MSPHSTRRSPRGGRSRDDEAGPSSCSESAASRVMSAPSPGGRPLSSSHSRVVRWPRSRPTGCSALSGSLCAGSCAPLRSNSSMLRDRGASEGVNRLVGVAHDRQLGRRHPIRPVASTRARTRTCTARGSCPGTRRQECDGSGGGSARRSAGSCAAGRPCEDEVVKVQRVRGAHALVVLDVGVRDDARDGSCPPYSRSEPDRSACSSYPKCAPPPSFGERLMSTSMALRTSDEALGILGVVDRKRRGQPGRLVLAVAQQ